jgi:hypothetical protein
MFECQCPGLRVIGHDKKGTVVPDKKTPLILVRKRTISPERPPLVSEISANFCG